MFKKPDKKSSVYFGIVAAVSILSAILILSYLPRIKGLKENGNLLERIKKEKIVKHQIKELDKLREGHKPLTEEETQKQIKE